MIDIEPDNDSYGAMRNGEWLRLLGLMEHRRDKMKREITAGQK